MHRLIAMRVRPQLFTLTVTVAALSAACAPSVTSVAPRAAERTIPPQPAALPGARLSVRTLQPLDSALSREGQPFTAALVAPLRAHDGTTLAPAGATVRGLVVATHSGAGPNLTLEISSIDTVAGPASLAAHVVDAPGTIPYAAPHGLARDAWARPPAPARPDRARPHRASDGVGRGLAARQHHARGPPPRRRHPRARPRPPARAPRRALSSEHPV